MAQLEGRATTTMGLGLVIALAVGFATSCSESPDPAREDQSLEGFWQTEGYGHFLEVHGEHALIHEVTAVSCLPSYELEVRPARRDDAEALLTLPEKDLQIDIQPGSSEDERWMKIESLASRRRLTRVEGLPEVCSVAPSTDPISIFDTFWQTYSEHYPFFAMKGVDWQAVGDRERAKLGTDTSREALFEILQGMISPLEDGHTYLYASDLDRGWGGSRPDPNPLDKAAVTRAFEIIDESYLLEPPSVTCNGQIAVGRLANNLRYLRLRSFNSFGTNFGAGMICLDEALDRLLENPGEIVGVVLDVRINGGGADPYGLAIASRFATEEYLAYTKETRNDPNDDTQWSEGQPIMVQPTDKVSFAGPSVLLIGHRSVSAAETFTMALMGRSPAIKRIGENTEGVFSDVLSRSLPNEWEFSLPNERFLTVDGRSFDGPGVSPDIEIPVFMPADLEAGVDPALEKAIEILVGSQ